MKKIINLLQSENGYIHFLYILLFYYFVQFFMNEFIITENFLYNSLFGQVPEQHIEKFVAFQRNLLWLSYAIFPIVLLLKWIFITAFIAMVSLFMDYKLELKQIFKSVMSCEWLFVILGIAHLFVLLFSDVATMADIERLNFVGRISLGYLLRDISNLEWLSKPFEIFNIMQVLYVFLLAYAVGYYSNIAYSRNLLLIIRSYLPLLFIWFILITYITVSYA